MTETWTKRESLAFASQHSSVSFAISVADGYTRWAPLYDDSPNPLLAREERYLLPLLGDVRKKKILDLACGTGRWLEKLAAHCPTSCAGIDCSPAMLDVGRRKQLLAGKLALGACECLPFATGWFDLSICSFALGHFRNLETIAAEAARVSHAGGDLFITDLHPLAYKQGWKVGFRDQQATAIEIPVLAYGPSEIRAAFLSNGWELVRLDSLWMEQPEQVVFARAGRLDRFASASQVPAILALHFRRPMDTPEIWET